MFARSVWKILEKSGEVRLVLEIFNKFLIASNTVPSGVSFYFDNEISSL